jgi:hypothetical protein
MRIQKVCSLMAAGLFAAVAACGEVSFPVASTEEFTATLSGAEEVPAVTTAATGTAVFAVIQDTILSFRVDVVGIDSTTASHIHDGAAGVAGPVIVALFAGPSACKNSNGDPINVTSPRCRQGYTGFLAQGQFKASQLTGLPSGYGTTARERFDSLLVLLRTGGVYLNVHNRANAGGHIRGQIQPR